MKLSAVSRVISHTARQRAGLVLGLVVLVVAAMGCRGVAQKQKVTLMLDWVPNTNHTGIYVALDKGWYTEAGIELEIIEPAESSVESVVGAGQAQFGISFAEWLTYARAEGVPVVSVAAIIQENTSGFASRKERGLARPADFAGMRYGGAGLDIERAMLQAIMDCDGASAEDVQFVDVGYADFFVVTEKEVDFSWIYYAWTGIESEIRGIPLNVMWLSNYSKCVPDYYTPVFISSEVYLAQELETAARFMEATARGYQFAIDDPQEAAEILVKHSDADPELVRRSQEWLSPRYQGDAPQWGHQDAAVWQRFTQWMVDEGLLTAPLDSSRTFTNALLPNE